MEYIGPGPIDASLLTLQQSHLSELVWNEDYEEVSFRSRHNFWQRLPAEPVVEVIRNTAFRHIIDVTAIDINNHLITALVERWRPETHTIHLPCGECTVTLEDVVYLLGLPINGDALIWFTNFDWEQECARLLGVAPNQRQMSGQRVLLTWLDNTFQELPPHADDVVIRQHARAFILRMIGGFLMPDTSGNRVNLMYLPFLEDLEATNEISWGSAVLSFLYRALCRAAIVRGQHEIGGCMLLLQCWAYERIPILAPRMHEPNTWPFPLVTRWSHNRIVMVTQGYAVSVFRSMLDRMFIQEFNWTPYSTVDFDIHVPDMCRARVPLICFALVEWHHPDRVMRQFGMDQAIPFPPMDMSKMHKVDLRGKSDYNWPEKHSRWVEFWDNRENCIAIAPAIIQPLYQYSDYMRWYLKRTRKYITRAGAYSIGTMEFLKSIRDELVHTDQNVCRRVDDMITAFSTLSPGSFSTDYVQAPPSQQVHMPPGFEEEQPQAYNYPAQPEPYNYPAQPQPYHYPPQPQTYNYGPQPHEYLSIPTTRPFGLEDFGEWSHLASPRMPNEFAATLSTPSSAFYRPQMPDTEEEEEGEEEEEEPPQLIRGRGRQPPPAGNEGRPRRTRRQPGCGTH